MPRNDALRFAFACGALKVQDARVAGAAGIEGVIDHVVVLVVIEVDDDVSRDARAGGLSLRRAGAP